MTSAWPPVPEGWQNDKAMQKLRVEKIIGAEIELEQDKRAAAPAANPTSTMSFALEQKLHETLYTVATGSIDRARSGAQFVQTAASAIGVLYTGVLAVIFVSDTPVPARGFIPTLFLAASIGLATAYLAFVNKMDPMKRPTEWGSLAEDIWQRTNFLSRYARAIVLQRAPLLRAAVISLAFGVVLLPIALIQVPTAKSTNDQAAEIAWPSAPAIEPKEVAVVLYQHQLDEFVKTIDTKKSTSSRVEDGIAVIIALIGLVLVWATATNRLWKDVRTDPDGAVVVAPAAAPRSTDRP
jgi:hypothetical protein